ncbi:MAG TPA: glutamate 2,3-aminomutase [Syntrophomonadaceae bacterium]|nr:glutamate 2,3-aminomutase [Syntrophomonadaceae bacterium]HPR94508.1 glutamate 2,3-aminomutase [Syntrophomonadaceae bacterium]
MLNFNDCQSKRDISLQRAAELKMAINDYLSVQPEIETGFRQAARTADNQAGIRQYFAASEADWNSFSWQMKNRISDPETLAALLPLSDLEIWRLKTASLKVRWAISPYYLSLVDSDNFRRSPVYIQAVPNLMEIQDQAGKEDPMGEETTNPAPCITRRYPDRLIINVTNQCGMYCRHCQRRRNFGETDQHALKSDMSAALQYIRENREIRDVLITGGDALMLSNKTLDWLLSELDAMEHVEIKRIGTRAPVTIPQRITPELCTVLKKHPPIYINTQFNHPMEATAEAKTACDRLIEAGVVLGNQAVLLKDINDDAHIMKKLNQELLKLRIRPYYLFHAKQVKGTAHFMTSVQTGLDIMKNLRGFTSGLAVPTYIINAPDGYGKTPVNPEYLLSINESEVVMKTWQGNLFHYPNHSDGEPISWDS